MLEQDTIRSVRQLDRLCQRLARAERVGLDTEFVSEDTYRPRLCLVQVATDEELAVIDALAVSDLTPLWTLLADGKRATIVHAGREELGFCFTAVGRRLARVFDTQMAAGLVGAEYPAGYAALVRRFLNGTPSKGETRTDWRQRPLSEAQLRYALEDVRYLLPLRDRLWDMLQALGRVDWLAAEIDAWHDEVEVARTRRRWRNLAGISGLSNRSLAVVRELWQWRDERARASDVPPRRVLRDDLLVEIARRKSADLHGIRSVRGLNRRALRSILPELADCVRRGLELPVDKLPHTTQRSMPGQLNVVGQFLASALTSICRAQRIAVGLVGTASDLRELVAYRLGWTGSETEHVPKLAHGWRAEVVGAVLDDLLAGKTWIRIEDPTADQPLAFEPAPERGAAPSRRPAV